MKNFKIKINLLFIAIVGITPCFSQNIVMNPGMNATCTSGGFAEITKTDTWTNANGGTVDLYDHTKSENCGAVNTIPNNYMGHQTSFVAGQNYAGINAFYDDGSNRYNGRDSIRNDGYKKYTEYLQGELTQPLVAGTIYQISFKVSLAEKSGRAVSCLGALLTSTKVEQASNSFLKQTPQFISHRVIRDSSNWVTLYGAYIADGGEKFITIGCFKDEHFQLEKTVDSMHNDSRKAYYYLTGISVAPYMAMPNLDAIVNGVDYIELMNIKFAMGSSEILPAFQDELNGVATWMKNNPDKKIFLAGYTDETGADAINDPLSDKRAEEVKKYLVQKGVAENHLITEGFGSSNPLESKIKSSRNRRVEIYLYAFK